MAAVGFVLSGLTNNTHRIGLGTVGIGAAGAIIGALLQASVRPDIDIIATLGWTVGVAVLSAAISSVRNRPPVRGAMIGAAFGWAIGAFGVPELGAGSSGWVIVATAVPAAIIGARNGMAPAEDHAARNEVDKRSRPSSSLALQSCS